jgi:anaerobic selenocysteine-containing dehydrogenase
VRGDRDHPPSQGYTCAKGRALPAMHHHPRRDYDHARLVVYLGVNPVVSHGHTTATPSPDHGHPFPAGAGRGMGDRPAAVGDRAARLPAHRPRPGADYAILAHLVRELLPADAAALAQPAAGVDELRAAVAPYTLEHAAAVADVPARELAELLAAIRRAGQVAIETGTGVTMAADANVVQWLAWTVMIVTDSMNRPGGVWFHPGFFRCVDAAPLPLLPADMFLGPGPASRPELPGFLGEWPCAALPSEIAAGNIRALLNLGGGLLTAFPDAAVMRRALTRLDVLATIEIIENETTALSTHVLPTKDQLERADINLWDHLSPRVAGLYSPAIVAPAGERRSAWQVLAELGRRLGHELSAPLPPDDRPESDDAMLARQTAHARAPFPVPHGYEEANVNLLTSHRAADPVTGMARYSGIPVSVHAAE